MHPRSALHKSAPDFVVHQMLTDTERRTYMSVLTAIDVAWLPEAGHAMSSFSAPLRNPPPAYNASADDVFAWHEVKYGMHAWDLPLFPGVSLLLASNG
jgi:ATP-dependent RNA helicase DHX37/DHR1